MDNFPLIEDVEFLEHYGVKGMRWGVVNSEDLEVSELKYGSNASKPKSVPVNQRKGFSKLSQNQKKAALAFGGFALVLGTTYLYSKYGKNLSNKPNDLSLYAQGLEKHWDSGINLPKDSVLSRFSSAKETSVRTDGFFACFKETDINHYKNLPSFRGSKNTYLIKLKSTKEIKAPSGKETFSLYKNLFDDETLKRIGREDILQLKGKNKDLAIEQHAKETFWSFSRNWTHGYDDDPDVVRFFSSVRKNGYNSLIDFFDSANGNADTPLRLLDGTMFNILENDKISHSFVETDETFLSHVGVKGMRWGVRKQESTSKTSSNKMSRRERKQAALNEKHKKASEDLFKFLDEAMKQPTSLILLNGRTVITGKEFVDHVISGGLIDPTRTGFLVQN